MCITYTSSVQKTEKDLIVFKLVRKDDIRKDRFFSHYSPTQRTVQSDHAHRGPGRGQEYKIGELITSDMLQTPGLYTFKRYKTLRFPDTSCILRVKIPAGTKVRLGFDACRCHCICAESIIPLKVVKTRC